MTTYGMCLHCDRIFIHPHIPTMCPGCYSDIVIQDHEIEDADYNLKISGNIITVLR